MRNVAMLLAMIGLSGCATTGPRPAILEAGDVRLLPHLATKADAMVLCRVKEEGLDIRFFVEDVLKIYPVVLPSVARGQAFPDHMFGGVVEPPCIWGEDLRSLRIRDEVEPVDWTRVKWALLTMVYFPRDEDGYPRPPLDSPVEWKDRDWTLKTVLLGDEKAFRWIWLGMNWHDDELWETACHAFKESLPVGDVQQFFKLMHMGKSWSGPFVWSQHTGAWPSRDWLRARRKYEFRDRARTKDFVAYAISEDDGSRVRVVGVLRRQNPGVQVPEVGQVLDLREIWGKETARDWRAVGSNFDWLLWNDWTMDCEGGRPWGWAEVSRKLDQRRDFVEWMTEVGDCDPRYTIEWDERFIRSVKGEHVEPAPTH